MALNTTRTPPQKSFGRRPGTSPAVQTPSPARELVSVSAPVMEFPQDSQPAPNWLSELTGQSKPAQPKPVQSQPVPSEPVIEAVSEDAPPVENRAAGPTAFGIAGRSLAVMARNPVTFLALVAATILTEQVAAFLPMSIGLPGWLVLPVLTTLGCMALYAASFHTALSSLKGERVNLDIGLRAMVQTPMSAWGIVMVTVSSFSWLLIIPAIGFAWRWVLAAPVAIAEGGDARARSIALATPYRAQFRLLVLLLAGLSLARGFLAGSLSPQSILTVLTGDWLFPMLLSVLTAVTGAVVYRELVPASAPPPPTAP
jgi:hypothetical protein